MNFPSTRRSLLLAMHQPELREEALAAIIEIYWKPTYKYIRLKWRKSGDDARDWTQDFFGSLIERELLQKWEPARASFRTYLRLCVDASIKNQMTALARHKRSAAIESLDFATAERELAFADPHGTPEQIFHREWQRRLFELALSDLAGLCEGNGRMERLRVFREYDLATGEQPTYEELSRRYGIPQTTVTNHLAWARREIRRLVLQRLAQTTAGDAEARREAKDLFR